jgi:hypothetical protein
MGKRNCLWHAKAIALSGRFSIATIALIVHVSERQVKRLFAAKAQGGAAGDKPAKSAAREMLEAIVEPAPIYAPAAPRRVEAVAALAGGATIAETAQQLGCTRAQVDRMRDSAALAGEVEPPPDATAAERARSAADRRERCDGHLADLVEAYGLPPIDGDGRPFLPTAARPTTRLRFAVEEGPMPIAGGYAGSGASSPAAACAELG